MTERVQALAALLRAKNRRVRAMWGVDPETDLANRRAVHDAARRCRELGLDLDGIVGSAVGVGDFTP